MTKTALVKIGIPSSQAESVRQLRRVRQIIEQHDAAIARLDAATQERIREAVTGADVEESDAESTKATA
jgi:hypothetical protein